jgi:hypothetical protein
MLYVNQVWLKVGDCLLKSAQQRPILEGGEQAVGGLETAVPRRPNRHPILLTLVEPRPFGAATMEYTYRVPLLLQGTAEPNGIQFCAAQMIWGILVNNL